jgi:hypothetical protein
MSLPEVYEVMRRIDKCKSIPNKFYMRAEFEFCARGIEVAGELHQQIENGIHNLMDH